MLTFVGTFCSIKRSRYGNLFCAYKLKKEIFKWPMQMKISFILYVFQVFVKNQHLTSHEMYIFEFFDFFTLYHFTAPKRCFTRTVQTFERLFWIIRLL